jgi:hypothetical protein
MDWLAQNWIWVLFGIAFVAMHLFGHGGHGGHGSHNSDRGDASEPKPSRAEGARPAARPTSGGPHRH